MGKEWIVTLAADIRNKNREAAEGFGKKQHKEAIVAAQGQGFFAAFVSALEDNVNEIRRELQGDVTASETTVQNVSPTEVKLFRSRFPWFDARIVYEDVNILLDYAKGRGVAADRALDRKTCHFAFEVADDDAFVVREGFGDNPAQFSQPQELAQRVTEILFAV